MRDKSSRRWCSIGAESAPGVLSLHGAWRLPHCESIWGELCALSLSRPLTIQGEGLESLDSASALLLLKALQKNHIPSEDVAWIDFAPEHARILEGVRQRLDSADSSPATKTGPWPLVLLSEIGRQVASLGRTGVSYLGFLGMTLAAFGQVLLKPGRLRVKELTVQFEQVCLGAIPVVSLVTMLIGVTVTYLLGLQAEKYGANIFVVDGVGIGMTREFSPIIVATIVAGRSGAAFTAHLGAMRLTEEIDAIHTLGLSPMQVLVVPRVLALVIALPLLVFIGDVMGVVGAMLVADPLLGLTPSTVVNRLHTALDMSHFWVGMIKAPVFALFIAVIGCRMGMVVARDTRAVGLATTSTVVLSIVSVILLDAAFAIVLQSMGI